MPATIYSRLNDRDFVYSRNDLRKIAYWIHEKYLEENGKDPDKIEQIEEDRVFQVFVYPDEWIERIDNITDWYFKKKRKIGEQHIKRELKAKAAKEAKEKNLAAKEELKSQKKNKGNFNRNSNNKNFKRTNNNTNNNRNSNRTNNQNKYRTNKPNSNNKYNQNPNNPNSKNRFQGKPNFQNKNYQNKGEQSSFSTFGSDLGNDFRNHSGSKSSYIGSGTENRFNQKVEIESSSNDSNKKRKRIAKALYVAAPSVEEKEQQK